MATRAQNKAVPPIPGYLYEQMTVARTLHFNKREQAQLVLDPGVQAFLIRATKAAADHLDAKVRHVWRSIPQPR